MRLIHLAVVASSSNNNSSGGLAGLLLPLVVIGGAMYFLLIRPQKRRQREAVQLQSSIEVGDEVMTTSGIYGFVSAFEGDLAWLEIDDNVQIRISRAAISRKVDTTKGELGGAPSDKDVPAPKSTDIDDVSKDEG